ncbi:hypothetical protein A2U01_0112320, partial [Trifolium medium]|nr:hypothetical protein [Trifolium medium]
MVVFSKASKVRNLIRIVSSEVASAVSAT